jgi:hypothetical protein
VTENQTLTIPHPTWTVTAYKRGQVWKVIAISPNRKHVLHKDKVTDEALATFDPEAAWGGTVAPKIVDFVADLNKAAS